MLDTRFTVLDLIDIELKEQNSFDLRCIGGRKGLSREITTPGINRPGLALSGFYDEFAYQRIQVLGKGEVAYLAKLADAGKTETIRKLFSYPIPCCIFTHNFIPHEDFIKEAERVHCPLLQTKLDTAEFHVRLIRVLSDIFASQQTIHGVLVEVYGMGILLLGDSGVGKSETALELIKRGHRLVADDAITIRRMNGNVLVGTGRNKIAGHHIEIRGVGIVNITHLFGVSAIRERKEIQLVITLEEWDNKKNYDRIGDGGKQKEFLGVAVPMLEIPVRHGRYIPVIVETAAMNERLKMMGYHAETEFNQNIIKWLESGTSHSVYFGVEDII
ncbi:MAG: HPr(Ser) kinase/phosphatase [Spirochaetaceae bacterium]|jgi:HPr kinase/phosphorylase|nr:HPr(Ser) kinase/phosphatase [Spirochaetaceae bacterium]